jgi:hypothetical protein
MISSILIFSVVAIIAVGGTFLIAKFLETQE